MGKEDFVDLLRDHLYLKAEVRQQLSCLMMVAICKGETMKMAAMVEAYF